MLSRQFMLPQPIEGNLHRNAARARFSTVSDGTPASPSMSICKARRALTVASSMSTKRLRTAGPANFDLLARFGRLGDRVADGMAGKLGGDAVTASAVCRSPPPAGDAERAKDGDEPQPGGGVPEPFTLAMSEERWASVRMSVMAPFSGASLAAQGLAAGRANVEHAQGVAAHGVGHVILEARQV